MEVIAYIIIGIIALALIAGAITLFVAFLPYLLVGGAICLAIYGIGLFLDVGHSKSYSEPPASSQPAQQYHKRSPQQEAFHNEALTYVYKKSGVNLTTLQPALDTALINVTAAYQRVLGRGYNPTVTSGDDYGGHCEQSAHYSGAALDFRLKDIDDPDLREMVTVAVRENLGDRFFVDHEAPGSENEHLHVQLRRGTYSKVAWH